MTDPILDPKEVAKFAQHANVWWETEGPLKTLHDLNPARLKWVQQWVTLAGQRVLDVGCGGGIFAEALAKQGACVTGLDVEPHAIAAAKAHAATMNLSIDYVCQPIESWQGQTYPIVTCMELLEHVPDPAAMVAQLARQVAPSGYLLMSTINRTPMAYATVILAAEYLLRLLPRQTHDYKKFIKPSELAAMARHAGLTVLDLKGLAYNPLTRQATLTPTVQANYMLVCRAPSQEIS